MIIIIIGLMNSLHAVTWCRNLGLWDLMFLFEVSNFWFLFVLQGISTLCLLPTKTNTDVNYAYHDEIGTPYCVTILDTTLNNGIVMFRSRNTTLQEFMHVSEVVCTVKKHLGLNTNLR